MRFLERERAAAAKLLPGLDDSLRAVPLRDLESRHSPAVQLFRQSGGPGLLVPVTGQGAGASALEAVRVQRALGSRSPSLAVATTMHHFSMATLVALASPLAGDPAGGDGPGTTATGTDGSLESMLMEGLAADNRLLASGFAEGRPGGAILAPTMTATVTDEGVRISGVKRPCSLARSMDLLTASVLVPRVDGEGQELAVALIPADSEGLSVSDFWSSGFLAGAESHQVTLHDVLVPPELLVRTDAPQGRLDAVQTIGLIWFELLMAGSYLGVASALAERVLANDRVPDHERAALFIEAESAMAAVENLARRLDSGERDETVLADMLCVRYSTQDAIARMVPRAVELLGGLNFMASDDVGQLAASAHGLALHPPSRPRMSGPLTASLADGPLVIA